MGIIENMKNLKLLGEIGAKKYKEYEVLNGFFFDGTRTLDEARTAWKNIMDIEDKIKQMVMKR